MIGVPSRSSNFQSKFEADDFWNDCMNTQPTYLCTKSSNNDVNDQYINFTDKSFDNKKDNEITNKNLQLQLAPEPQKNKIYNNLLQKFSFDRLLTEEEIVAKKKHGDKIKQSMERSFQLYEKGKIKTEIQRIMINKNEELKKQNELKDCTWKPSLTKINKKMEQNIKLIMKDTKIYNRNVHWKVKNSHKINRSKSDHHKEVLDNTFKPNLNLKPNLSVVFDHNRSVLNDHGNRNFVLRLDKAREEITDKKRKLTPDLSRHLPDKWSRINLNKSLSMTNKFSNFYKQTLRNELHSIKYEDI